jgi:Domain of unknown function (DUF397)
VSSLPASPVWRKSSYSGAVGNCVELAWLDSDQAAIRTSRNPAGPALSLPRSRLHAFVEATKSR